MAPTLSLLQYLLLSGAGLALFYLCDRLFLAHSDLFKAKRAYYFIAWGVSLLAPLLALVFPIHLQSVAESTHLLSKTIVLLYPETNFSPDVAASGNSLSLSSLLVVIWSVGSLFLLLKRGMGAVGLWRFLRHCSQEQLPNGEHIYLTAQEHNPFIYFRTIVLPYSIYDSPAREYVLAHERAHRDARHYMDLLLSQISIILQWWNPFAWGLLQAVKENLEYLADRTVLAQGKNKRTYQEILMESSLRLTAEPLSLSFSVHLLKKRIITMNQKATTSPLRQLASMVLSTMAIATLLLASSNLIASPSLSPQQEHSTPVLPTNEDQHPDNVGQEPFFPGGMEALMKNISQLIKYPEEASKANIQGRVFIQFVVDTDGKVIEPKVTQGVDPLLDAEALRVIKLLPPFKPGVDKNGKPIKCRYSLPINFRLGTAKKAVPQKQKKANMEQQPFFPGGMEALMKNISQLIKYPEEAAKANIQGRVFIQFVVDTDGKVIEPKVTQGVDPLLDAEALRVIKLLPPFKPGVDKNGKPIKYQYSLPIRFSLEKKAKAEEAQ